MASQGAMAQGQNRVTLLVKTAKGLPAEQAQSAITRNGGTLKKSIAKLDLHVFEVPAQAAEAITRNLRADATVTRVETSRTRKASATPSDPLFVNQWALPKIAWDQALGAVAPVSWQKVAILDTGIEGSHADLAGTLVPGTSIIDDSNGLTDPNGHGTWLAGIVAARTNNVLGMAGVGFDYVQVMPVKVLNAQGEGQDADVIAGVMWAADNGASVILMAFSSPGFSESLQEAIDYAWSRNVVLVAAAGNEGANTPTFPAGDRGVIGVSGTDQNDLLVMGSNFGTSVFLAAPGASILGTAANNGYSSGTGTSAAAAIVAGSAALMRAVNPGLTNGVVVNRLARTADPAGTQDQSGNGRVQLARALEETSTESIQPAGTAPLGNGGPFVGPYRAGSITALTMSIHDSGCSTSQTTFTSGSTACSKASVTVNNGAASGNTFRMIWYAPGSVAGTVAGTASPIFAPPAGPATTSHTNSLSVSTAGTWTVVACKNVAQNPCSAGNVLGTATFTVAAPISITPSYTATNKVYDGNTSATVMFQNFTPSTGAERMSRS